MNRYELTYIIDTGLEETARKELIEKISQLIAANGGEVEKIDETWGKRRLAYAINYKTEGWYVLVTLKAPAELPREIERNMGNMEAILRYLFVRLEEKRSNVKPRPVLCILEFRKRHVERLSVVHDVVYDIVFVLFVFYGNLAVIYLQNVYHGRKVEILHVIVGFGREKTEEALCHLVYMH